jgi:hypothetical protein
MTRAAIIANRLWDEGNRAWRDELEQARDSGQTLLERIEQRTREWEAHLKNNGAVPQHRDEDEVTGVVIDLDMERHLREALKQRAFMKDDFIDEIFAHARQLSWKETRR